MVLMPSSPTAFQEVSAYNDGRDNSWILPHASGPITNTFLRQNGVRYFVVSRHAPGQIPERLKSGAVLMLRDPTGFDLYRIDPTVLR